MKRGAPTRRRKPPPVRTAAEMSWKLPQFGTCRVCGHPGILIRHHVVYRQTLRVAHKPQWDMRNALSVGTHCDCHERHHSRSAPISMVVLSNENLEHAFETLGPHAALYLRSRYVGYDPRVEALLLEHDARP